MKTEHSYSMRSVRPALLLAALSAVCAVMLSGCASSSSSAQTAQASLPAKNMALWTMPLDQYSPTHQQEQNSNYATELLMVPCLEKAGYQWPVPWQDTSATLGASYNLVGVRLFTLQLAQQYGYHSAPKNDPSSAAWLAFSSMQMSQAESDAASACVQQVYKSSLAPLSPTEENYAGGLQNQAFDAASQNGAVKADVSKWRACMATAGVPDLPTNPQADMPSQSLRHQYGLDSTDLQVRDAPAGAQEIKVATQDARCRETSGYTTAFYNAQWQDEVKLLDKNADALQRYEAAIKKYDAAVKEVIAAHAPTH